MPRATLAIQVLPLQREGGLAAVNAAIDVIHRSGVAYEVGPLETVMEGDDARTLAGIALRAHSAALEASASLVQSNIRLLESPDGLLSMNEKTASFRGGAK